MTYFGEPSQADNEPEQSFQTDQHSSNSPSQSISPIGSHGSWMWNSIPLGLGLVVTGLFYGLVQAADWAPLNRYFMGHPVAIAATTLFCIAASILFVKAIQIGQEHRRLLSLRDEDLEPLDLSRDSSLSSAGSNSPTEQFRKQHDAGYRARFWRKDLETLPSATRKTQFVRRLDEVLMRQSHRSSIGELPEDLRELSIRDADAAHDSLGLIRIIVWAIPMLGFLGTVIGITQTLGGLDFTDGTAAVDRLKSGLYVAFDTTALGLVLSVVAIFLQFPVERSHQTLLSEVDLRVRHLVSSVLGGEDVRDNHTALITQLCDGIKAAVAQSLATQAEIWNQTIVQAQQSWQTQQDEGTRQFGELIQTSITPALQNHADGLNQSVDRIADVSSEFQLALQSHKEAWQEVMDDAATEVQTHRRTLLTHTEAMTTLAAKQAAEDDTLRKQLRETVAEVATTPAIDFAEIAAPSNEAMKTLAKAVEVLATRLPGAVTDQAGGRSTSQSGKRRAA